MTSAPAEKPRPTCKFWPNVCGLARAALVSGLPDPMRLPVREREGEHVTKIQYLHDERAAACRMLWGVNDRLTAALTKYIADKSPENLAAVHAVHREKTDLETRIRTLAFEIEAANNARTRRERGIDIPVHT